MQLLTYIHTSDSLSCTAETDTAVSKSNCTSIKKGVFKKGKTPKQVQRLIPDEEDGLLSRFIYYFIPFRRGIRNVFATDCISNSKHVAFKQLGENLPLYTMSLQNLEL